MGDWKFTSADFKNYPHFDRPLPLKEVEALVKDPKRVAAHGFFPFLRYEKRWQPFRTKDQERKKKVRAIRYAARADAYIYAYYRHLLAERYEAILAARGLAACVIAYRKIKAGPREAGGKCNIHFAQEAFAQIQRMGDCCAIALDISSFFESIDHIRLKKVWCDLLGERELPPDHASVFRHITNYAEVDRDHAYEQLGYLKQRQNGSWEYLVVPQNVPIQLCPPGDFRRKICASGLVKKNKDGFGIPQGAPISDLLANAYLLEFDMKMQAYAKKRDGFYLRYSDDILIVVPGDGRAGRAAREYATRTVRTFGDKLEIKAKKANTVRFRRRGDGAQSVRWLAGGRRTNGLEYLGFRFDGTHMYLRDSTLANLNRKITRGIRGVVHGIVARYPGKDITFLLAQFDIDRFMKRYGRVEDFEENGEYRTWTFWSYARRAAQIMGARGLPIFQQLRSQKQQIHSRAVRELAKAIGGGHGLRTGVIRTHSGVTAKAA